MTLATICDTAFDELGWTAPATYAGNDDPDAKQAVALANRVGRSLAQMRWQKLIATHTFSTVRDTATYALPSDFQAFANLTWWDRTNYEKMIGPASPAEWQELQSGLITVTPYRWFRIAGDLFTIYPTPPLSDETIAYDYYSNLWCESSGGTGQTKFLADSDVPRLDEDLFILGLKWRFREAKGLAYQEDMLSFDKRLAHLREDDGGAGVLRFGPGLNRDPVPDTGFGS